MTRMTHSHFERCGALGLLPDRQLLALVLSADELTQLFD
jgi:hypothetical protein